MINKLNKILRRITNPTNMKTRASFNKVFDFVVANKSKFLLDGKLSQILIRRYFDCGENKARDVVRAVNKIGS